MKILYAITAYPPATGGAQTHFHELAKRINNQRHEVQVVCHWKENRTDWLRGVTINAPSDSEYEYDNIKIKQINLAPKEHRALPYWTWSYYMTMGNSVRKISEALHKKMDMSVGPIDLVHAGRIGREFLAWAAFHLARQRKVPFVLTPFHHPRWTGLRYRWYLKLYLQADAVMALTQAEKRILTKLGVAPQRIHVIGHAPALPDIKPRTGYFGSGGPVVLFLGQKYAYKGLGQLLKSMPLLWKERPDTRFAYLGPRTAYSKRKFKKYNDSRIIEKDRVTEEEKIAALADCAAFCLPSRQESFGGVYTEAWMQGKPVIGADIPAVAELIQAGQDGELVSESPGELANTLIKLLSQPDLAAEMGRRGREKVKKQFNWERIANIQRSVYLNLIR